MRIVFKRPEAIFPLLTYYCPGCGPGIIPRLLTEVIDEFGIRERVGLLLSLLALRGFIPTSFASLIKLRPSTCWTGKISLL